jgi:hypothetical protein
MTDINKLTLEFFSNSNSYNKIKKESDLNIKDVSSFKEKILKYLNKLLTNIDQTNMDYLSFANSLKDLDKQLIEIFFEIIEQIKNEELAEICQQEYNQITCETIENIEDLKLDDDNDNNTPFSFDNANKLLFNETKKKGKNDMKKFLKTVGINSVNFNSIIYPKQRGKKKD